MRSTKSALQGGSVGKANAGCTSGDSTDEERSVFGDALHLAMCSNDENLLHLT